MNDRIKEDFARDVYCLLGLPIDNMTIESTKKYIHSRTDKYYPIVWSTVNVNWVVQSFRDKEFRKAIIKSDLVTLDGKPLLWLSKLLGYPMTEVVPGSTMIQNIHEDIEAEEKLSIFFFGGEGDVGSLAMENVNSQPSGLRAVGAINPGFGTVEEMSSDSIIEAINKAKPDILLVALGAKKGTAWIEYNRDRLNAKIISHLGATVNFLAGTVRRAPRFFQIISMEWLWRILQEPKLVTRYALDGWVILCCLVKQFSVLKLWKGTQPSLKYELSIEEVEESTQGNCVTLSFGENISKTQIVQVRRMFSNYVRLGYNIILDFQKTEFVGGGFAALILILKNYQMKNSRTLEIVNVQNPIMELLRFFYIM